MPIRRRSTNSKGVGVGATEIGFRLKAATESVEQSQESLNMTNSGLQQQQQQQRIRYTMAPDDGDDESPPAATSCAVKVIEPSPGNTTTGGGGAVMSHGQQQQQQQQQQQHLCRARQWLFLAHFAAQFSQNAWQFALVFFLSAFSNFQS
jgi:hypothetical protein